MGISDENLKRIFKPFFTTKSAGEGHGLGLSICQQILRSYGGDVIVESKPGRGTRMKIQLQAEANHNGDPTRASQGFGRVSREPVRHFDPVDDR